MGTCRLWIQVYFLLFVFLMSIWHFLIYGLYHDEYRSTHEEGVSVMRIGNTAVGLELTEVKGSEGSLRTVITSTRMSNKYSTAEYSGLGTILMPPKVVVGCPEIISTSLIALGCSELLLIILVLVVVCVSDSRYQACLVVIKLMVTLHMFGWYLCFNIEIWLSNKAECGDVYLQGIIYCIVSYVHLCVFLISLDDHIANPSIPVEDVELREARRSTESESSTDLSDSSLTSHNTVTPTPHNNIADLSNSLTQSH